MKAKLNAALILLTLLALIAVPARAQLASYLDDQGNLVYTNSQAARPVAAAKPVDAPQRAAMTASPQPASSSPSSGPNSGPGPAAALASASASPIAPAATASAQGSSAVPVASPQPLIPAPAALDDLVQQTAEKHNVDPDLVRAVISTESNWNASAVSRKGAQGLMQLVPGTAHQLGVADAFDPAQNVDAGVRYLGMLLQRYNGDLKLALAAYNAGPGVVDRFGVVPNFRETRHYVDKVTSTYFRPGSDRHAYGYSASRPIHRETTADGRVVFTNE